MRNDTGRMFILLVEDNPGDAFLVGEAFREAGLNFQMNVVEDGDQAIRVLNEVDADANVPCPHVLLLDLNLPRRTGEEVLERVRQSPRGASMPVVVITSSESPEDRAHAFELGATEYFCKPSSLDEFMEIAKVVTRAYNGAV